MKALPESVSLQQAALWAIKGEVPIDEGPFALLGQSLQEEDLRPEGRLRMLWHSLVQGKIYATGYLGFRSEESERIQLLSVNPQAIAPWDWIFPAIDWNGSTLHMNWDTAPSCRLRQSVPAGWIIRPTAKGIRLPGEFFWCSIEVNTTHLIEQVPSSTDQKLSTPTAPTKHPGGRPPKFDWHELYSELVAIAASGKLPKSQAACERLMLDWCSETWGSEPSVSVLRTHVARIYTRIRRDGN